MNVIITGSTGMVGKGVLFECIRDSRVKKILLINRSHLPCESTKVDEILHNNFTDFSNLAHNFKGYDACFHCMGVSSAGISKQEYFELTYIASKSLAETIYSVNPSLVFTYVSGSGTYTSEKGPLYWARVKGKTENFILNLGFKDAYTFRPNIILPEDGIQSKTKLYNIFYNFSRPFFPLLKKIKSVTTTRRLGKAMINVVDRPQPKKQIEAKTINRLSE